MTGEQNFMRFTKMHGCQNDFVIINCFDDSNSISNPNELARKISDRRQGVGSDGLILILPSDNADAFMQIYNSDGSQDTMCGNGIRCVAKYVYEHGIISPDKENFFIETLAGVKAINLEVDNNKVSLVSVDMGVPGITSEINEKIIINDMSLNFYGIDTGTPHAIYFVEDNPEICEINSWPDSEFAKIGVYFENNSRFPDKTSSDFVKIISRDEINMRVFERGCGETMACGTGSTASVFAGVLANKLNRDVLVHLRGGDLRIKVDDNNKCFLIGPAVEVFSGEFFY